MRQSKAKKIRKEIYGDDFSPRTREYKRIGKHLTTIINLGLRRQYLLTKKANA